MPTTTADKNSEHAAKNASVLPLNISGSRDKSESEQNKASKRVNKEFELLKELKAVISDIDASAIPYEYLRERVIALQNLDVERDGNKWMKEGINKATDDYGMSLRSAYESYDAREPERFMQLLYIAQTNSRREVDWILKSNAMSRKEVRRIGHELHQYLGKSKHASSGTHIERGLYRAQQEMNAKNLTNQLNTLMYKIPNIETFHNAVVDLQSNLVQMSIIDAALSKDTVNKEGGKDKPWTVVRAKHFIDFLMSGTDSLRGYGIKLENAESIKEDADAAARAEEAAMAPNATKFNFSNSSTNMLRIRMREWWKVNSNTPLLDASEAEKDSIYRALNDLLKDKTENAVISEYKILNEFWLSHTTAITDANLRAYLLMQNNSIQNIGGLTMMWRQCMATYICSPSSPMDNSNITDSDLRVFLQLRYNELQRGDTHNFSGSDDVWRKVSALRLNLKKSVQPPDYTPGEQNDVPPPPI